MSSPATSNTVGTYTCASCEVTWTSYESACWMCGRSAATGSGADPTRAPRTTTSTGAPAHQPVDILRAHAMGLPDPRYVTRTRASESRS